MGVKPANLPESGGRTPSELPDVSTEAVASLLPAPSEGEESDAQNRLLRHVVLYGAAESGVVEEGVALAELERWRDQDCHGWERRERNAEQMFEGRMMKLLSLMAMEGKSRQRDTQSVLALLQAVNPERWAREHGIDRDKTDPIGSMMDRAFSREREQKRTGGIGGIVDDLVSS